MNQSSASSIDSPNLQPWSSNSSRRQYLRRTPTNQTEETQDVLYDSEFFPKQPERNDEVPSVRPVVDNHDRLWAEIDVLNDAAEMAQQVKTSKSFFGPNHAQALEDLRTAQAELVQVLAESDQRFDTEKHKTLWENGDVETVRRSLFDQSEFDKISNHVANTRAQLDNVAKFMDAVDEQSKDYWQPQQQ